MSVCLLPEKVDDFKQALKEKEVKISDLLNMTSEERTALLEKYAGENAKAVNTAFEEKLVLKNKMLGIKNWASKVGEIGKYSAEGKAQVEKALSEYRSKQQERIFNPKEDEAFLNDLADKKLGVHVPREVAQKVFELTQKAEAMKDVNVKMSGVGDEYLQARNELNDYVASQKNTSVIGSISKNLITMGRDFMLANPSTPIKTVIGQTVNSAMDFISRRIGTLSMKGGNYDLARQANNEAWATFRATGKNTASMEGFDDTGKLGEKQNFATSDGANSTNPAVRIVETGVRKVAQGVNKVVIDWEHNYSFTKFYQKTFFDSANLFSAKVAKEEGLLGAQAKNRAGEIFKDAVRIKPETKEGQFVRSESQKQAARVTSTNPTLVSKFSLGMKNMLNNLVPNFPVGDLLVPIAKIPANLLYNGIENAGVGIPHGIYEIVKGYKDIQSTDVETRYEGMASLGNGIQRMARTVGVLTAAAYFTSKLQKSDFRQDNYGNNFVKIGNWWINLEYIAAVSPALAGMMEVKSKSKPGQDFTQSASQYVSGVTAALPYAPGADEVTQLAQAIHGGTTGKYLQTWFTSRSVPAFIPSIISDRRVERLLSGKTGVETVQEVKQDEKAAAKKAADARKK